MIEYIEREVNGKQITVGIDMDESEDVFVTYPGTVYQNDSCDADPAKNLKELQEFLKTAEMTVEVNFRIVSVSEENCEFEVDDWALVDMDEVTADIGIAADTLAEWALVDVVNGGNIHEECNFQELVEDCERKIEEEEEA